jgi:hypothetical protein
MENGSIWEYTPFSDRFLIYCCAMEINCSGALRNDHQSSNLFLGQRARQKASLAENLWFLTLERYTYDVPDKSGFGLDVFHVLC